MFRNSSYEEESSETDSQPTSMQQQMIESDNDSDNDMQVFAQFVQEAYENIPEDSLAVLLNKKSRQTCQGNSKRVFAESFSSMYTYRSNGKRIMS